LTNAMVLDKEVVDQFFARLLALKGNLGKGG
jgi:hypothetical protein